MHRLPPEARRQEEQRDPRAKIDMRMKQRAPQRRRDDPGGKPGQIEEDQVLAQQADAGDRAEREPPALIPCLRELHEAPAAAEPDQRLHHVGREQQSVGEEDAAEEHGNSTEPLREASAAEEPRQLGGQADRRRHAEGRDEPERQKRRAEERIGAARDQRHERRLVDIAERRVLAANDEIQLVAEDAIAVVDGEVGQKTDRRQHNGRPQPPTTNRIHASLPRFLLMWGGQIAITTPRCGPRRSCS
jgi:hypothetical protein